MKYVPETIEGPTDGVPSAEPGDYIMNVVRWKEDVATRNGTKDVIDFVGTKEGEPSGQDFGASLWISGPGTRPDGRVSKGNLWQYRKLAEALGPDAVAQYRQKDATGFSTFRPIDWTMIPVKITVGAYGVDTIEAAPVQEPKPTPTPTRHQESIGDPQNLDDGRHDDGSFDDIPF